MIQLYADGVLAYDSRLEDYDLIGLKVTNGLNKGGTAEIVMPPVHPAYSLFTAYKTIVELYRDGVLLFRGRALNPADDFYKRRTITCEGELCFFNDTASRPYLYQDTPSAVFAQVLQAHNDQADAERQFKLGRVTVVDDNDYIRLESETDEQVLDTVKKLLDRCGGYIVFTTDATDGARVANWLAELEYRSDQEIEFGENLLNYATDGANTDLITAVLPRGAKDEETGERITIEGVNDGLDYIVDDQARSLRGFIIRPVTWDDVTLPDNLLRKAQQYLEQHRYIVTSLKLTALDLSYLDKSIDSFQVGDRVRVKSAPHGVDEDFLLTEYTEDLLKPGNNSITLGKEKSTLTGADVAGDEQNRGELYRVTHQIKSDYTLNTARVVEASELALSSLIEQTSTNIKQEVSETYTTNDQVTGMISTSLDETVEGFYFSFDTLEKKVDDNNADARAEFEEIHKYIHLEGGDILLGNSESAIKLKFENDLIVFTKNDEPFGWWDGVDFHTGNIVVEVNERAQFGNFAFVPRSNGSLSFLKVR